VSALGRQVLERLSVRLAEHMLGPFLLCHIPACDSLRFVTVSRRAERNHNEVKL
jgi:hypothetical protein